MQSLEYLLHDQLKKSHLQMIPKLSIGNFYHLIIVIAFEQVRSDHIKLLLHTVLVYFFI